MPQDITRSVVLELCRENRIACLKADVKLAEILSANEVFCSGKMGETVQSKKSTGDKLALQSSVQCSKTVRTALTINSQFWNASLGLVCVSTSVATYAHSQLMSTGGNVCSFVVSDDSNRTAITLSPYHSRPIPSRAR